MSKKIFSVKDSMFTGLAIGLVSPALLSSLAIYLMNNVDAFKKADLLLIGCVAVNILWMNLCYKFDKDLAGRGVVSATFLCAFVFLFYKIFQEL